jgi:RNA polymerase sigma-70 factor (ECF subfamily)
MAADVDSGIAARSLAHVARFQAGDAGAFDDLYALWAGPLRARFRLALRDPHGAEDAVQQVMLSVLRALPRHRVHGAHAFDAWMHRIARNQLLNEMRSRARVEPMEPARVAELWDREDVTTRVSDGVDAPALAAAYEGLPVRQRQVLALRVVWGFSSAEVAGLLGLTDANVRQLLARGRRALVTTSPRRVTYAAGAVF